MYIPGSGRLVRFIRGSRLTVKRKTGDQASPNAVDVDLLRGNPSPLGCWTLIAGWSLVAFAVLGSQWV